MNVVIEVVAAEGFSLMTIASAAIQKIVYALEGSFNAVTTLIAFVLQQGGTSQNAVSPTNNFEGSLAVA